MKYNELTLSQHQRPKRVGRGIASGKGKTAGRGTKGYGSRTGSKKKPGFVGGQNPLMQQLPKLPGFRSLHPKADTVHTGQLERFAGQIIDANLLAKHGLIAHAYSTVKLLTGKGELTKAITVTLPAASAGAIAAVTAAGGTFTAVDRLQRPARKPADE